MSGDMEKDIPFGGIHPGRASALPLTPLLAFGVKLANARLTGKKIFSWFFVLVPRNPSAPLAAPLAVALGFILFWERCGPWLVPFPERPGFPCAFFAG